jgi:hypothetical protein
MLQVTDKTINGFKKSLEDALDSEIRDLQDIASILGDTDTLSDVSLEELRRDVAVIKAKQSTFEAVKGMIVKASMLNGNDGIMVMTLKEQKMFFKIVKIIYRIRKFLRLNK